MSGTRLGAADAPRPPGRPARRQLLVPSRAREVPSPAALARRRLLVRIGRLLLPGAALLLLSAIALWPELDRVEERARVSYRVGLAPGGVQVLAPRYDSVDREGRPFTVTAERAEQRGAAEVLELLRPRADLFTSGGWLLLEAEAGRYDRQAERLELSGGVTLWEDRGTTLSTERATILTGQGTAEGDRPVAAQGPFGTLDAEGGFRVTGRGEVVRFLGPARAMLEDTAR
ncbi:MAG: LPS export ABC transporter periplasmic protein LptC [Acetobacteraceae bacterium]|nr:LPS export ABC transporter periplasmic protein LptC [Acetobacteraceae bacterium]